MSTIAPRLWTAANRALTAHAPKLYGQHMTHADMSGCLGCVGYVVVSFFTPNYRELADAFWLKLSAHDIPHKLYAWEPGAWQQTTMAKPLVVQRAMADFPGRLIVLMDVDCDVRGPIAPALDFPGDVALWLGVGIHPQNERGWRTRAMSSSRILIWRQNAASRRLLDKWSALTEQHVQDGSLDEEQTLVWALEQSTPLTLSLLDRRYAARNPWECPADSVIVHKTISREITSRSLLPQQP